MITRLQKMKQRLFCIWKEYATIKKERDPISLQNIRSPFSIVRNDVLHYYDAFVLFNYIMTSGDFTDPITRTEYNNCELLRLDHAVNNPPYFLMNNKQLLLQKKEQYFITMGLCDVFEQEMYDQLSILRDIDDDHGEEVFLNQTIPLLIQCYDNFKMVSVIRCKFFLHSMLQNIMDQPFANHIYQYKIERLLNVFIFSCK